MLIYFFLTSGLFLGWSLGANDAANIFGTAVGSRMVKFRTAAIVASIFVILGAVFQGSGTTKTLSELGSVDALGGAFTVALCSAIVVTVMTRYKLPVSTGQAIVGAIMGWCFFTGSVIDYGVLGKIVGSWIFGPVLGAIFSALLYLLLRKFIRSSKLHLLKMETIIRLALIIAGAFGAYSLGANNIANVMGVFVNSFNFSFTIGTFVITSTQVLFLLGSIAIAVGIFTYSKNVMQTIGGGILAMTPEAAIVVVLSQALVLFVFSSTTLSNITAAVGLPPIPLVPVSSTQVVVGSVVGLGLVRGMQEIRFKMIGNIMVGWILTPVLSGFVTFVSLFFVQSVFGIQVSQKKSDPLLAEQVPLQPVNYEIPFELNAALVTVLIVIVVAFALYFIINYLHNREKNRQDELRWKEQKQFSEFQKALSDIEVNTVQLENTNLASRLEEKRNELVTFSLNISEQKQYLERIYALLQETLKKDTVEEKNALLKQEMVELKQKMTYTGEVDKIYQQAELVHALFIEKLNQQFPDLTASEKRLLVLLRIGLSSKEIAPLLNISIKSVEISRYRLRKKLKLDNSTNLVEFTKTM